MTTPPDTDTEKLLAEADNLHGYSSLGKSLLIQALCAKVRELQAERKQRLVSIAHDLAELSQEEWDDLKAHYPDECKRLLRALSDHQPAKEDNAPRT